jgi:hypothetical protein
MTSENGSAIVLGYAMVPPNRLANQLAVDCRTGAGSSEPWAIV